MGSKAFLFLSACILSALYFAELSEQSEVPTDVSLEDRNDSESFRIQRHVIGGEEEQNPKDPQYMPLAIESMVKYLQSSGITVPYRVDNIYWVTTQVISGYMMRIYFKISPMEGNGEIFSCFSKVWLQPATNIRDVDVTCQAERSMQKINTQVVPEEKDRNPNDPKYFPLATESMEKYLKDSGITVPYRVLNIYRVTYQVVAGDLTRIYFKITPMQSIGEIRSCFSKVWVNPWISKKHIDVTCQVDSKSEPVFGGEEERNPNNLKYMELAIDSMEKYLQVSGITVPYRVVNIQRVTHQVVNGDLTRIYFIISPMMDNGPMSSCYSKVWDQPWTNGKKIDVLCYAL